jgi:hypothetical protein
VASFSYRLEQKHPRERAEQVLEALVSLLNAPALYNKFTAALPLARICLLLLGDRPSSVVATQVLLLIGVSLNVSSSFSRKFELVSGWSALKVVLPDVWDASIHEAAFDILLGRVGSDKNVNRSGNLTVVCPNIMPAVFAALHVGLNAVARLTENAEAIVESAW